MYAVFNPFLRYETLSEFPGFKLKSMARSEQAINKIGEDITEIKLILEQLLTIQFKSKVLKKKESKSQLFKKHKLVRNHKNKVILA